MVAEKTRTSKRKMMNKKMKPAMTKPWMNERKKMINETVKTGLLPQML